MAVFDFLQAGFFQQIFWGNKVLSWLGALALALGLFFLIEIIKTIGVRTLQKVGRKAHGQWALFVLSLLLKTKCLFILLFSFSSGTLLLTLPAERTKLLSSGAVIVILLQTLLWGNAGITFLVTQYRKKNLQSDATRVTAMTAVGFLGRIALILVLLLIGLDNMGVKITTLVAGLGIGGIAVGLATQQVLGDIFASLVIILDKPFVIGDFITTGNFSGNIEHVGLKTTRVRSLSGEEIVVSNSNLLNQDIHNYKKMQRRRIVFCFGVLYETPAKALKSIPQWVKKIIDAEPETTFDRCHFKSYGDSSLDFEVVYFIESADYTVYMNHQQAINFALFDTFAAEKIGFAYPTRTLYVNQAVRS